MAGRRRYRECKVCGARVPFVTVSSRGLCPDHGRIRLTQNIVAMKNHRGPEFEYWRERCLAAFGGGALDEASDES